MQKLFIQICVSEVPFKVKVEHDPSHDGKKYVAVQSEINVGETNLEGVNLVVKEAIKKLEKSL